MHHRKIHVLARSTVCALVLVCAGAASAQRVHGTVTDDQHNPMEHATVAIPTLERRMATDAEGHFAFTNIRPGVYAVVFSRIGYESVTREVEAGPGDLEVNVTLSETPLEIPAVTVTAKPQPAGTGMTAQPVAVLEGSELDRLRGEGIMGSISSLPGVAGFSRGPIN